MKKKMLFPPFALLVGCMLMLGCSAEKNPEQSKIIMVIHGGAGTMTKDKMSSEKEKAYTGKLTEALQTGYELLESGKSSVDAVQATINVMEDSPLFNAGKGAVLTHDGRNELDASIMSGANRQAGAVAGVTVVKNPIDAAREVLERSKHILLSGKGAEIFAKESDVTIVDTSYFYTERRWKSLQRAIEKEKSDKSTSVRLNHRQSEHSPKMDRDKLGTVGCVALDQDGNITAGTSTGGLTNKKHGRIGDSPIIGAGTYANNQTVGISSTGQGEYFMREMAAHRVSDLMELKDMTIDEAAQQVMDEIGEMGGTGGMIGLDAKGHAAMPFNTEGMYRGTVDEHGNIEVQIYK